MIIGLAARARVGKNTFAEYLKDIFIKKHDLGFNEMAFANILKQMCADSFDLTYDQLWGDNKEESTVFKKPGSSQGAAVEYSDGRGLPPWYWTPREIMQEVGSFYRSIDSNYWVRALDNNIKNCNNKNIIITDVRHINECEYVKKNGILIRLLRSSADTIHGMSHESETALDCKDSSYFDIEINNDGTLDDFYKAAENTVEALLVTNNIKQGRLYNG